MAYPDFGLGNVAGAGMGRAAMIRNGLFALAASLMTLGAFGGTVAIMTVSSGAGAEVA